MTLVTHRSTGMIPVVSSMVGSASKTSCLDAGKSDTSTSAPGPPSTMCTSAAAGAAATAAVTGTTFCVDFFALARPDGGVEAVRDETDRCDIFFFAIAL